MLYMTIQRTNAGKYCTISNEEAARKKNTKY
jgi:hypothetical protein